MEWYFNPKGTSQVQEYYQDLEEAGRKIIVTNAFHKKTDKLPAGFIQGIRSGKAKNITLGKMSLVLAALGYRMDFVKRTVPDRAENHS